MGGHYRCYLSVSGALEKKTQVFGRIKRCMEVSISENILYVQYTVAEMVLKLTGLVMGIYMLKAAPIVHQSLIWMPSCH